MELIKRYEAMGEHSSYFIDVSVLRERLIAIYENQHTHKTAEVSAEIASDSDARQQIQPLVSRCISQIEATDGRLTVILDISPAERKGALS